MNALIQDEDGEVFKNLKPEQMHAPVDIQLVF